MKKIMKCKAIRISILLDKLRKIVVNLAKSYRYIYARFGDDSTISHKRKKLAIPIEKSITHSCITGVYTQNSHLSALDYFVYSRHNAKLACFISKSALHICNIRWSERSIAGKLNG